MDAGSEPAFEIRQPLMESSCWSRLSMELQLQHQELLKKLSKISNYLIFDLFVHFLHWNFVSGKSQLFLVATLSRLIITDVICNCPLVVI